jgi:putative ABC transport system permease protein
MDQLKSLGFKLRSLLRRRTMEADMAEEMNGHLEQLIAAHRNRGMTPGEARNAAFREFGNRASIAEQARDQHRWRLLDNLARDVRYAVRQLRRAPAVSATAVLSLSLGLGASVAVFSAVHAVLLKDLPFRDAGRLAIVQKGPAGSVPARGVALANALEMAEWLEPMGQAAPFTQTQFLIQQDDRAERVVAMRVAASFFRTLAVAPALGRDFLPADDTSGAPRVAIISSTLWRGFFAGDPNVLGRTLGAGRDRVTIVGVMPDDFRLPELMGRPARAQIWMPLAPSASEARARGASYMYLLVKRAPGVAHARLEEALDAITREYTAAEPRVYGGEELRATPIREVVVRQARPTLLLLWAAVSCLLLIACANAANVVLSRAATRTRELAVRASLGASRPRLLAQLITESAVLAAIAAAIGVGLAAVMVSMSRHALAGLIPRADEIAVDWGVLRFTVAATVLTALGVSVLPVYRSLSIAPREAMGEGGTRSSTEGLWASSVRRALLVAQIAIAVGLGSAAILLGRSLEAVLSTNLGFEPKALTAVELSLPDDGRTRQETASYYEQLIARLASHPRVRSVGAFSAVPLSGADFGWTFEVMDKPVSSGSLPYADLRMATPGALEALEVPLHKGRLFQWSDRPDGQPVAIVNETFATRVWPDEDPIGKQIKLAGPVSSLPWMTVVGVVADVRLDSPDRLSEPTIYRPQGQHGWRDMTLVVRTQVAAEAVSVIRAEVSRFGGGVAVLAAREFTYYLSRSVIERRIVTALVGVFAACALALALVGVYGLFAYAVASRTREIGVRMALGASGWRIVLMMMRQAIVLCVCGLVAGVAAIFAARGLLGAHLFEVEPMDPATLVVKALTVVTTALVACYVPSRRALTIDPTTALRAE